ncbi:hypothetical protein GY45DRAFT_1376583 [Cubamyces sp. BRFM 1775]|nr:hypothetical protein GY45DRAFT_1376583 [Cubamyces sp. BRFM 1775]
MAAHIPPWQARERAIRCSFKPSVDAPMDDARSTENRALPPFPIASTPRRSRLLDERMGDVRSTTFGDGDAGSTQPDNSYSTPAHALLAIRDETNAQARAAGARGRDGGQCSGPQGVTPLASMTCEATSRTVHDGLVHCTRRLRGQGTEARYTKEDSPWWRETRAASVPR